MSTEAPTSRTIVVMALVAASARLLAPADSLRRRWLRVLGPLSRPLMRDRDLRVALLASLMILSAGIATLALPLWLLVLGPLVWGVPHLVADLRYLVVGPGYHRRRGLALLAALPILAAGFGAPLGLSLTGAAFVTLAARAPARRRLVALAGLLALAAAAATVGRVADLIFAHLHNFIAVALWWAWRPRRPLHYLPLGLFIAVSVLLLTPLGLGLAEGTDALRRTLGGLGSGYQLARLAPGVTADLGLRLVLLFAFTQAIHYGIWLHLVPDDDRPRATPPTFRRSYLDLCRDLGAPLVVGAGALTLFFAAWAVVDVMAANHGYFRLARFHGLLEVTAATLLLLEGRLPWSR